MFIDDLKAIRQIVVAILHNTLSDNISAEKKF